MINVVNLGYTYPDLTKYSQTDKSYLLSICPECEQNQNQIHQTGRNLMTTLGSSIYSRYPHFYNRLENKDIFNIVDGNTNNKSVKHGLIAF